MKVIVTYHDNTSDTLEASDEKHAKKIAKEEAKWESCKSVSIPEIDFIAEGDFAIFFQQEHTA
jgi:hypothetical protein